MRILQAAVEEFGAKGYAGARTAAIAARAGVNQQLISYYFGGKKGLLDELRRRWASVEATMAPDVPFKESFAAYLDATLDGPDWARLAIWQALGDHSGDPDEITAAWHARMPACVERIRARQEAGEITGEVDPEFVLLLTHALAFAPIALPHMVESLFGADPLGPERRQGWVDQLTKLLRP
jgi:AcrR family transcriptional regulator